MARPPVDRLALVRPRQRAGPARQRRARPRLPLPPAAREGQAPDRAAALLLGGGRRGRRGRRSPTPTTSNGKQVVVTDEELGSVAAAQDAHDRHRGVRRPRRRRPDLLRPPVLPRPGRRSEGTLRAYRLLVEVMERSGRVALGRFVMRTKEYLAAVRARDGALALTTMRSPTRCAPRRPVPTGGKKPTKQAGRQRRRGDRGALDRLGPRASTPTATASACGKVIDEQAQGPEDRGAASPKPSRRRRPT